jgi:hypothetical protein
LEAVKESLSSLRRLGDTSSTKLRNGDIPLVAIESHPRIVAARAAAAVKPATRLLLQGLACSARHLLEPRAALPPLGHPHRYLAVAALASALVDVAHAHNQAAEDSDKGKENAAPASPNNQHQGSIKRPHAHSHAPLLYAHLLTLL